MLKLQIGQILTKTNSDLSGVLAYFQAIHMQTCARFAYTMTGEHA